MSGDDLAERGCRHETLHTPNRRCPRGEQQSALTPLGHRSGHGALRRPAAQAVPTAVALSGGQRIHGVARLVTEQQHGRRPATSHRLIKISNSRSAPAPPLEREAAAASRGRFAAVLRRHRPTADPICSAPPPLRASPALRARSNLANAPFAQANAVCCVRRDHLFAGLAIACGPVTFRTPMAVRFRLHRLP